MSGNYQAHTQQQPKPVLPRAHAPQEKPLQWEARAPQQRGAPAANTTEKPAHSNEDLVQPKIN